MTKMIKVPIVFEEESDLNLKACGIDESGMLGEETVEGYVDFDDLTAFWPYHENTVVVGTKIQLQIKLPFDEFCGWYKEEMKR